MAEENHNIRLGRTGESLALCRYVDAGYVPLARNWRAGRRGELDIVVADPESDTLVFAEVKTRSVSIGRAGDIRASDSVGALKRRKIRYSASLFLSEFPEYLEKNIRFDVAEVYNDGMKFSVEIFENAF